MLKTRADWPRARSPPRVVRNQWLCCGSVRLYNSQTVDGLVVGGGGSPDGTTRRLTLPRQRANNRLYFNALMEF